MRRRIGLWVKRMFVLLIAVVIAGMAPSAVHSTSQTQKKPAQAKPQQAKDKPIHILVPSFSGSDDENAVARLRELKFKVSMVDYKKLDPDRLELIDVIFMPTGWSTNAIQLNQFESKTKAFHNFVKRGGGLLISQPNPCNMKNGTCTPAILPYPITFFYMYDDTDKTRLNLNQNHFITEDLLGSAMPFPADPMTKIDRRYKVLAKQKSTGRPSLAVCKFGDGRVVVQTANENHAANIPISNEILRRMVVWAAGREPVMPQKK